MILSGFHHVRNDYPICPRTIPPIIDSIELGSIDGISNPQRKNIILPEPEDSPIDLLVKEEKVRELTEEVKQRVNEFVLSLSSFDSKSQFAKIYYDLLW